MHAIFFLNTPEIKNIRIRAKSYYDHLFVIAKHSCKFSYLSEKIMSLF
jgi:hypothetical protein